MTKGPAYYGSRIFKERPNIFNEADRELHRKKRKTVGPAISERAMRFFEQDMSQEVDIFLALLLESSTKNEVVNMTPRCERLGVDIVGRLAFGFELKSQREPTHRHVAEGIKARSAISSIYMSWPSLRILNPVITWLSPRHRETDKENLYKSLRTMIGSRMVLPKEAKHDFYAQVSGELGPDELWSEAILIVGAGMLILCLVLLQPISEPKETKRKDIDITHRGQHNSNDHVSRLLLPFTESPCIQVFMYRNPKQVLLRQRDKPGRAAQCLQLSARRD